VGILGVLGFFIFQVKIFTFLSQNLKIYLNLLELLLFRSVHHSIVAYGIIFVYSLVVFLCPL